MRFTGNFGILLLGIYLILVGISALASLAIPLIIMAILALASGILLIIGR
jgi:hypothetical protein